MRNHTHLIVVPETECALSAAMRDIHSTYAALFNRKYDLTGYLWQARFLMILRVGEYIHPPIAALGDMVR